MPWSPVSHFWGTGSVWVYTTHMWQLIVQQFHFTASLDLLEDCYPIFRVCYTSLHWRGELELDVLIERKRWEIEDRLGMALKMKNNSCVVGWRRREHSGRCKEMDVVVKATCQEINSLFTQILWDVRVQVRRRGGCRESLFHLKMAVCGLSHQQWPVLGLCDGDEEIHYWGGWAEVLGQAEQRWMCTVSTKVIIAG